MDTHYRKIDLQSPADLEFLATNIKDVAQKKIDLHIPPSAAPEDGDDVFRTTVNDLVQQYVRETLKLALPSIAINGMEAMPAQLKLSPADADDEGMAVDGDDAAYEPYDPRLANQLRDLYAALETETTKVAELRRDAPAKAAQTYLDHLQQGLEQKDLEFRQRVRSLAESDSRPTGLENIKLERQERVRTTWTEATSNLEKLRGVTEAVAVLERAKLAAEEIDIL